MGVNDPTALAWVIVTGYLIAAALSARAYMEARRHWVSIVDVDSDEARLVRSMNRFWGLITVLVVVLGVNKQLDLQTLLINNVRRQAYVHGWYGHRRRYQAIVIVCASSFACVGIVLSALWLRRVLRRMVLAIVGTAMLVLFTVVRATSFHYVDKVLARGPFVQLGVLLELGGIVVVILSALLWSHQQRMIDATRLQADEGQVRTPLTAQGLQR